MIGAVGKELGGHEIKMVTGLKVSPVFPDLLVVAIVHLVGEGIQSVERIHLHFVSKPGGKVAFLICPGNG
jgi:hypothetical protein